MSWKVTGPRAVDLPRVTITTPWQVTRRDKSPGGMEQRQGALGCATGRFSIALRY
ncbi:hypothetical protein TERTU_3479 [Teredinibacter turnerae T7901]|uniref:Uncharacterized protein n=1 Tax=Teredinibacter turnerae (strain ATCC 39867 / T7901) TaxID=377629 RepID=C5BRA5_TERTT|nr:hypothetical protein TERTU_3479 [Teredinibacter turnerae T7901]